MDNIPENRKRRVQSARQRLKQRREERTAESWENTPQQPIQKPKQKKLKPTTPKKKRSRSRLRPSANVNRLISISVLVIVIISVYFLFIRNNSYRIFIGDTHIATVPFGYTSQDEFTRLAIAHLESSLNTTVSLSEEIILRPSNTRGGGHVTVDQALTRVANVISYQVEGGAFIVDGVQRFILSSYNMSHELIRYIAQGMAPEGAYITSVTTPNLQIEPVFTDHNETTGWHTALAALTNTTREIIPWVVSSGESFWSIGMQLGLTVEEILELNPALPLDHLLQQGEVITVAMNIPLVTISTTEELDIITNVQPPVEHIHNPALSLGETNVIQQGIPGQMRQLFNISRTNGIETGRSLISQEYLAHPTPYIIEIGS